MLFVCQQNQFTTSEAKPISIPRSWWDRGIFNYLFFSKSIAFGGVPFTFFFYYEKKRFIKRVAYKIVYEMQDPLQY